MAASVRVRSLWHAYGAHEVVRGMDFALEPGRIGCLLGPSGCGKTTVLRCLAGFEPVQGGEILLSDRLVSKPGLQVAPERRGIGMVFQDYALFPHLTVAKNVAFGLARMAEDAVAERTATMLTLVGLSGVADVYPHELSGGQQQRVALARALAPAPDLLLLDEPFSNLDVDLRERISLEVREILKTAGTTALLVTHDQNEAFAIADEIGVMKDGVIEQWDSAYNLYHRPRTRFVADFVGQGVFLRGVAEQRRPHAHRARRPRRRLAAARVARRRGRFAAAARRYPSRRCEPMAGRSHGQGISWRGVSVHAEARLGHARALARAFASQSRDRRIHRHSPRDRSRRRVSRGDGASRH